LYNIKGNIQMEQNKEQPGIVRAAAAVGGQVKLAELLGVTQQAVSQWVVRGYPPQDRVIEIEHHTGVPRAQLVDPRTAELLDQSGGL
jgi:DNA-binding transcriptional regulator YdaS (Cro superfamily)